MIFLSPKSLTKITYLLKKIFLLHIKRIQDLETMRNRIAGARKQLREALERFETPGDWSFLTRQIGVASLTGLSGMLQIVKVTISLDTLEISILVDYSLTSFFLSEKQVDHLADKHHLYILPNGRINFTAITCNNVEYVANGIHETLTNSYFYEII